MTTTTTITSTIRAELDALAEMDARFAFDYSLLGPDATHPDASRAAAILETEGVRCTLSEGGRDHALLSTELWEWLLAAVAAEAP